MIRATVCLLCILPLVAHASAVSPTDIETYQEPNAGAADLDFQSPIFAALDSDRWLRFDAADGEDFMRVGLGLDGRLALTTPLGAHLQASPQQDWLCIDGMYAGGECQYRKRQWSYLLRGFVRPKDSQARDAFPDLWVLDGARAPAGGEMKAIWATLSPQDGTNAPASPREPAFFVLTGVALLVWGVRRGSRNSQRATVHLSGERRLRKDARRMARIA